MLKELAELTPNLTGSELKAWLQTEDPEALDHLWRVADEVRQSHVGDEVHLRGLIEISNICDRQCLYCGLRAGNQNIRRYQMTQEEILECAQLAVKFGYGTVVLQAGERLKTTQEEISNIIRLLKAQTGLAITLSLGERREEDWKAWKEAGADRYSLRFETSNLELFSKIHPNRIHKISNRLEMLRILKELGYEIGSGVMIGIPGSCWDDLVEDFQQFRALELDMLGMGPYLPHPQTPMGQGKVPFSAPEEQIPNTALQAYKAIALARVLFPTINIPSTTALGALDAENGRILGLKRGANVIMPNLTHARYQAFYEIYPDKACMIEAKEAGHQLLLKQLHDIHRKPGKGRGYSLQYLNKEIRN